jgi:hypothetical protein
MRDANERGVISSGDCYLATCGLDAFVDAVHSAARTVGRKTHERYGARKVFIGAIWNAIGEDRAIAFDAFGERLIEAHRRGMLSLARADLVAAMPREAVRTSEIGDSRSEFHFVVDPAAIDPWVS